MRVINKIIVHCSATKEFKDFNAKDIDKWHKARGWNGIGYHYVILRDGTIEDGRSIIKIGSHAKGHNKNSIGVCYIGGLDVDGNPKDTRTLEQKVALKELISSLKLTFQCEVIGHNNISSKSCPCFDAKSEYKII